MRIWIFLIVFLNKPINRTNPNRLVWFDFFWKTVKTEPIQTDELIWTFFDWKLIQTKPLHPRVEIRHELQRES